MIEKMQLLSATLALFAAAGAVVVSVALLARRRSAAASALVEAVAPAALWLAAFTTAATVAGSLYFSEVAHYEPCKLCWFQRIAVYPMPLLFAAAALRRDRRVGFYIWPAAAIGMVVAGYHWFLERFPSIDLGACSTTVPCSAVWFTEYGFVTLAFMALSSLALAAALAAVAFVHRDASAGGRTVDPVDNAGTDRSGRYDASDRERNDLS